MQVPVAALSFVFLATALGPPAHGSPAHVLDVEMNPPGRSFQGGVHRPSDCCFSHTRRKIQCIFMKDYFLTSGGCSHPAVVFFTKKGQRVCVHPDGEGVQECILGLPKRGAREELQDEEY